MGRQHALLGFPDSSAGKESACNARYSGLIPGSGSSPAEGIGYPLQYSWASLVAQMVKNLPAMRETWVRSLGWDDPLEEDIATHSSILAWRIPMDRGTWWATVHGVPESDMTDSTASIPSKDRGWNRYQRGVNPASNTPDPWHSTNRWKVCLKALHRAAWSHTEPFLGH